MSSAVVAGSPTACPPTAATGIVVLTGLPPSPPSFAAVEAWIVKEALPKKFAAGVNLKPALACANVMKSFTLTWVAPSF